MFSCRLYFGIPLVLPPRRLTPHLNGPALLTKQIFVLATERACRRSRSVDLVRIASANTSATGPDESSVGPSPPGAHSVHSHASAADAARITAHRSRRQPGRPRRFEGAEEPTSGVRVVMASNPSMRPFILTLERSDMTPR
jgi:hypothetical protein